MSRVYFIRSYSPQTMIDVEALLENQVRWASAIRAEDVPRANRHAKRIMDAVHALRETEAGRAELERLLASDEPNLRLWAAGSVSDWAPDAAIPVLAGLVHEPFGEEVGDLEDVNIRVNAEGYLARFFDLHPADLRPLPDRLADMGIGLPEDVARKMRRER